MQGTKNAVSTVVHVKSAYLFAGTWLLVLISNFPIKHDDHYNLLKLWKVFNKQQNFNYLNTKYTKSKTESCNYRRKKAPGLPEVTVALALDISVDVTNTSMF